MNTGKDGEKFSNFPLENSLFSSPNGGEQMQKANTSSEFQKNIRKSKFGRTEFEHNFDPLIVGLESGNADSLSWTPMVDSNQEPPISAKHLPEASATILAEIPPQNVTRRQIDVATSDNDVFCRQNDENVDDFFSRFDRKSAVATKSALKTLQRIEKNKIEIFKQ